MVSEQVGKVLDKYSTLNSFLEDEESHPNLKKFMKRLNETDCQVMKLSERVSSLLTVVFYAFQQNHQRR
ncbi:hypothetical protein AP064_03430 [Candidatus Liberibacter solanacearum]|uniref:hypothetical protein n=1 Tax=Candidatus Liberibacter solanacearum TaxID=556287 RepID=UPI0005FA3CAB|nr:hypothetical protein [Candidatus Liberibacter solanacearum]KQC49118.1 hypothetical protein AP064_03430 [Candidatus Liberibacter solanacearum]